MEVYRERLRCTCQWRRTDLLYSISHGAGGSIQQDKELQRLENETEGGGQFAKASAKSGLVDPALARRSGYGTRGEEVTLWANYFELLKRGDPLLFRSSSMRKNALSVTDQRAKTSLHKMPKLIDSISKMPAPSGCPSSWTT